mmetsp:Transcript_21457/g.31766  ORF Transcript_21457/g.31766 Transcript_21457/m.31766 type:complete len:89 (-) Transcript_21457:180-446(-)
MSFIQYSTGGRLDGKIGENVPVSILDDYYEDFSKDKLVVAIKLDIEGNGRIVLSGVPKIIDSAQNIFYYTTWMEKNCVKSCSRRGSLI